MSWGTRWGPPWEIGGEGHPRQAYLTLELGCELGWPGCGDGWGGGGIDCGVCTCWPGDGEDSMVRLFWLTWKWRGLSLLACHTFSLLLRPHSHPHPRVTDPICTQKPPHPLSLTQIPLLSDTLRHEYQHGHRAPPRGSTHTSPR